LPGLRADAKSTPDSKMTARTEHPRSLDDAPFGTFAPTGIVKWAVERARSLPDTWAARRAVIVLRRLAAWRLAGRPVDVEAIGARMRLRPYNNICEKKMMFTPHIFDAEELAILSSRLEDGFVFIDIGANIGAYSLFVAARAGPRARILAGRAAASRL
jgi:hypothetical protein